MKVIYKYPIQPVPMQELLIPSEHRILKVAIRNNQLYLWALVDTSAPIIMRGIFIYDTGIEIGLAYDQLEHIDTIFVGDGLVKHIFMVNEE